MDSEEYTDEEMELYNGVITIKRKRIESLYKDAMRNYKANGKTDYDAGIVEGLKRAIELMV